MSGRLGKGVLAAVLMAVALILVTPRRAEASIHEIIAALCRAGGEEVVPFGQNKDGKSFLRALQASGFITSIEVTADLITINFDVNSPNSKYKSAGFDLFIPDGVAPGVDLLLAPLPVPDMSFPAHSLCHILQ